MLFTIEVPNKDFWMIVHDKVLADFSFALPSKDNTSQAVSSSDDVTFEGEEAIE